MPSSSLESPYALRSAGGPPGIPVVLELASRSFIVVPLANFGINGDDSVWINFAFSLLQGTVPGLGGSNGPSSFQIGKVELLPFGNYQILNTINQPPQCDFDGHMAVLSYSGSSDCIRWFNPTQRGETATPTAPYPLEMGVGTAGSIRNVVIDGSGTNPANACNGIHMGDLPFGADVSKVVIRNFTGTFQCGLYVDNQISYTERARIQAAIFNCATCVGLNKSTNGSESIRYNDFDLGIWLSANQNGVVVSNGAHLFGGRLRILSNAATSSSSMSNSLLTVTGANSNLTIYSQIFNHEIIISAESDLGLVGGLPATITFGSPSAANNNILNCWGSIKFQNSWTASNAVAGSFTFGGPLSGDATLASVNAAPTGWP